MALPSRFAKPSGSLRSIRPLESGSPFFGSPSLSSPRGSFFPRRQPRVLSWTDRLWPEKIPRGVARGTFFELCHYTHAHAQAILYDLFEQQMGTV